MSATTKTPYREALPVANEIIEKLTPYCERVTLAGSLRRGREMVGDIELVALPKRQPNLLGEIDLKQPTALDAFLAERKVQLAKDGPLYKQFQYGRYSVDLFLPASADHWGCIHLIRTGSHEFNMWLMNTVAPRAGVRFESGRLLTRLGGRELETPEEVDVFKALGLPYIISYLRDDGNWIRAIGGAI